MNFVEKSVEGYNHTAKHEFMISFLTPDGRKGWLFCTGFYDLENGLIIRLQIKPLRGLLTIDRDDVEKVMQHMPTQR